MSRYKGPEQVANWRANNREKALVANRRADFSRSFGISIEKYEELLVVQGGKCWVCRQAESALSNRGKVRRLSIDHCHTTGRIRGLLCYRCNYVLGLIKDDSEILRAMVLYLATADTGLNVTEPETVKLIANLKASLKKV